MDIYPERLLLHYHGPQNYGLKDGFELESSAHNRICGDQLTIRLKMDNGIIKDVCFEGQGCVMSLGTASILSEDIKGKTKEEVKAVDDSYLSGILGTEIIPSRRECAMLALETIKKMI